MDEKNRMKVKVYVIDEIEFIAPEGSINFTGSRTVGPVISLRIIGK